MKSLDKILKPLALASKWAFLFISKMDSGNFQIAYRAVCRKALTWSTYTTLFKFPLSRYIDLSVDKDITRIRKVPQIAPKWLCLEVYLKLLEEYSELTDSAKASYQKRVKEDMDKIQAEIVTLTLCIQLLVGNHNFKRDNTFMIEYLKTIGIESDDDDTRLKLVESRLSNKRFALNELIISQKSEKLNTGDVKREDYIDVVTALGKNGYNVDYNMAVAQFISALNHQRKENEEFEKLKNKR